VPDYEKDSGFIPHPFIWRAFADLHIMQQQRTGELSLYVEQEDPR